MIDDLKKLIEPETAGNPCTEEKWVRPRLRHLSKALNRRASPTTIGRLLRSQKYGLRGHRKVLHTGKKHEERDRQFRYIQEQRASFQQSGDPHISVDAKKKVMLGEFKNSGQTWCQEPIKVNDHDFLKDSQGRATPYGIYDAVRNEGHVCVTTSRDTADLAVDAVRDWWMHAQEHYPDAKRLLIEADSGGSNAAKSRLYKKRLQEFADESGLEITVCHYPSGTSKWNPIEHRLFSQISMTWAGQVLHTLLVVINFIRHTTTTTGLKVTATEFDRTYTTGIKVPEAEFKAIHLTRHEVCPQWNYTICPRPGKNTT